MRERASLRRFLMISVATWARPDAAHDFSTDPKRRQWNSKARILSLNPRGRRQTKKYRATVGARGNSHSALPGGFHRTCTAPGATVIPIRGRKNG